MLGRAVKVEGEVVGLGEITTFIFAASSINFLNFFYIIIPEAVVTLTVRRYAVCTHRVTVTGGHQDILSVITYLLAGENWSFASCVVFHKTTISLSLLLATGCCDAVQCPSVQFGCNRLTVRFYPFSSYQPGRGSHCRREGGK